MRARSCLLLSAAAAAVAVAALAACSSSSGGGANGSAPSPGASSGSGPSSGSSGGSQVSSATSGSSSQTTGSSSSTGSSGGSSSSVSSGSSSSSASSDLDGGPTVDCSTPMPSGGQTFAGSNVNGKADGFNYGIWATGDGGTITVFPDAPAFAASWNNITDFLAHLGLDFDGTKPYTAFGTITAQFVESKTGTAGSYSSIGMYGWMHSPCVEWYINEDSFSTYPPFGSTTVTIDGDEYYVSTSKTSGTGGANACEASHTGPWVNMTSTRKTPRQCGTIVVSDHFAAWANQGWSLGNLASVHVNLEVGGGTGSIQFPLANVTTTSN